MGWADVADVADVACSPARVRSLYSTPSLWPLRGASPLATVPGRPQAQSSSFSLAARSESGTQRAPLGRSDAGGGEDTRAGRGGKCRRIRTAIFRRQGSGDGGSAMVSSGGDGGGGGMGGS
eukprot:5882440-Prymnesium_polylepis.1